MANFKGNIWANKINRSADKVADLIEGLGGNDTLTGGSGDDTLDGGTGTDVLIGGLGNDTYIVDSLKDKVQENAKSGTDTIKSAITLNLSTFAAQVENLLLSGAAALNGTGNALDNVLSGNGGNNTLSGLAGDDTLNGLAGRDALLGGEGADVLNGGTDNDTLNGGAGDDLLKGEAGADTIVFNRGDGQDTMLADGLDIINLGSGIAASDLHVGVLGAVAPGTVMLDLGQGDGITLSNAGKWDGLTLAFADGSLLSGTQIVALATPKPTEPSGPVYLPGTSGDDTLQAGDSPTILDGQGGRDLLLGGKGNDTLYGGQYEYTAMQDYLDGGEGSDTYILDNSVDVVRDGGLVGIDTAMIRNYSWDDGLAGASGLENFELENVSNVFLDIGVSGNGQANRLTGNDGRNTLDGRAGNDTLVGGKGNDVLTGGEGADTFVFQRGDGSDVLNIDAQDVIEFGEGMKKADLVIYRSANLKNVLMDLGGGDQITLSDLSAYTLQLNWADGSSMTGLDLIALIRGGQPGTLPFLITGTSGADTLNGDVNEHRMDGLGGDDLIFGGDGNDTILGGDGSDTLKGGSGDDLLNGGAGRDFLAKDGDYSRDTLLGGDGDDHFTIGGVYGSKIDGGAGADVIELTNKAPASVLLDDQDLIKLPVNSIDDLGRYLTHDWDTLHPQQGQDNKVLLAYRDPYNVEYGPYSWIELTPQGPERQWHFQWANGSAMSEADVALLTRIHLFGDDSSNTLTALPQGAIVTGYGGNDRLTGSDQADVLDGGKGVDTMTGGLGDDRYYVTDLADRVIESAVGGFDTVVLHGPSQTARGSVAYYQMPDNVEQLYYGSDGTFIQDRYVYRQSYNVRGTEAGDVIRDGGANGSQVDGRGGDDAISVGQYSIVNGGAGNDTISATRSDVDGGAGNDVLISTGFGNTFTVSGEFGDDEIHFSSRSQPGSEQLQFKDVSYNRLWFTTSGGDLLISVLGSDDSVTIKDWSTSQADLGVVRDQPVGGAVHVVGPSAINLLVSVMAFFQPQDMSDAAAPAALIAARDQAWFLYTGP
jgi:Ca2+-binding RTX toxin-like protein